MSRWDSDRNKAVYGDDVTPAASAARTANGDSGWLSAKDFSSLSLLLDVTAVGGDADETLDVVVETASSAAGANSRAADGSPFTQRTQPGGAGSQRKTFTGLDDYYRVRWTVGGTTPSFTFSVSGSGK